MRTPKVLRSKKFWGGTVVGMIAGPWALGQVRRITGVGVSVPKIGNGS